MSDATQNQNSFTQAPQQLLMMLLEHIPDRIYFKDTQSRFVLGNPALATCLGVDDPQKLIGKTDFDFFTSEHAVPAFADEQEVMRTGNPVVGKLEEERFRDGRIGWASTTKLPLRDSEGRIIGTFGLSRDVTDHKLAQDQLQQANIDLAKREQQLLIALDDLRRSEQQLRSTQLQLFRAEKLTSLGQLVAGIAHEINNPLSFIFNNLAVLHRDIQHLLDVFSLYQSSHVLLATHDPALMRRIDVLTEHVDLTYSLSELGNLVSSSKEGLTRIRQTVADLRNFSSHEAVGEIQDGADLSVGIESTVRVARTRARQQKIELESDIASLPPVSCSPAKINQVLLSLIFNAIDACREGGKVIVRGRGTETGLAIQVIDNGSGIDPGVREKIFDPFFTTKPQGQGSGLGLSISYGIIAEHGGKIEVDSAPGRGSTFTIHLPCTKSAVQSSARPGDELPK